MPRKPTVKTTARLKVKGTLFSLVDLGTQCSCFQVVLVEVSEAVHLNVFLQSWAGQAAQPFKYYEYNVGERTNGSDI